MYSLRCCTKGAVAHLVEHQVRNLRVVGSSPIGSKAPFMGAFFTPCAQSLEHLRFLATCLPELVHMDYGGYMSDGNPRVPGDECHLVSTSSCAQADLCTGIATPEHVGDNLLCLLVFSFSTPFNKPLGASFCPSFSTPLCPSFSKTFSKSALSASGHAQLLKFFEYSSHPGLPLGCLRFLAACLQ